MAAVSIIWFPTSVRQHDTTSQDFITKQIGLPKYTRIIIILQLDVLKKYILR